MLWPVLYIINILCIVIDLTLNEHLDYSHLGDEVYGSTNQYYYMSFDASTHTFLNLCVTKNVPMQHQ